MAEAACSRTARGPSCRAPARTSGARPSADSRATRRARIAACCVSRTSRFSTWNFIARARLLDPQRQQPRQAVAARIGRDERMHELRAERLRLVVARRADKLRGADDRAVQARDEELPLGHQQHAAEIRLQRAALGRAHPAEAAALDDRGVRRLAQRVQVVLAERLDALDRRAARRLEQGPQRAGRVVRPSLRGSSAGNWPGCADRPPGSFRHGTACRRGCRTATIATTGPP